MTKITYLEHSGFAITLPEAILVFDYYRDPSHALHKILEANPDKQVVFFVSHQHADHYNTGIFELAQNHRRTYVVSNDVPARTIPSQLAVAGMSAGDTIEGLPGDMTVKAYPSTDTGVSFMVTTKDGKKIFHAGDLNDWHWQDESTFKEVEQANDHFKSILNRIASENPSIDIAMFPVDARQGSDYARGARLFLEAIKVKDFFPMHFGADRDEACRFDEYARPDTGKCHCLCRPGESVELS